MSLVLAVKPAFMHQLAALPSKLSGQILSKLEALCEDPAPDGSKVKLQLKGTKGLYRMRSGDYRIFYTYDDTHVSVLKLDKRQEDTYDALGEPETLGAGPDAEVKPGTQGEATWTGWIRKKPAFDHRPLPAKLTEELLDGLGVPEPYWTILKRIETEEALYAEEKIPDEWRLAIAEAVIDKGLDEILRQPDFVAEPDELLQFKPGELIPFLLRLNPEQEKYVAWGVSTKGPTLLKGAAGTGKSTVALYRARAMVRSLRKRTAKPRILFTTYTNALVRYSEPLLEKLLAEEACVFEVRTADSLTMSLARQRVPKHIRFPSIMEQRSALRSVWTAKVKEGGFEGNRLQVRAKIAAVEKAGFDYVLEELLRVIQARAIDSLEGYLATPRAGRLRRFSKTARTAVWELYEGFAKVLLDQDLMTWERLRWEAVQAHAEMGDQAPTYDGVIVDEVQDLDPSVVRLVASMVRHPGGLFLTADADQSIYGSSFRWKDVHDSLSFTGRTGILKANHRTTREIGEAARSYLGQGALETEKPPGVYVHQGPPPAVRAVDDPEAEVELLARFALAATKEFRLPLGAAAVLVPTKEAGRDLERALAVRGVDASFMPSDSLDLRQPGVKIMPLVAAKGLEFPVVAIAGFLGTKYPYMRSDWSDEAKAEALRKARRTMYVGMTRAMRALLVVVPAVAPNDVLEGFDPAFWNTGAPTEETSA